MEHEIDLPDLWLLADLQSGAGVDDDGCLHLRGRDSRLGGGGGGGRKYTNTPTNFTVERTACACAWSMEVVL